MSEFLQRVCCICRSELRFDVPFSHLHLLLPTTTTTTFVPPPPSSNSSMVMRLSSGVSSGGETDLNQSLATSSHLLLPARRSSAVRFIRSDLLCSSSSHPAFARHLLSSLIFRRRFSPIALNLSSPSALSCDANPTQRDSSRKKTLFFLNSRRALDDFWKDTLFVLSWRSRETCRNGVCLGHEVVGFKDDYMCNCLCVCLRLA